MKFQLITSASALLLSTVPAALAGVTQTQTQTQAEQFAKDIQGQGQGGHSESGTVFDLESNYEIDFANSWHNDSHGDGDVSLFSEMFVATPRNNNNANMRAGNAPFRNGRQVGVRQAQNTWQRLGGTCWTAWPRYSDAINRIIQRLQRARQTPRSQGRIAGLNQELQRIRRMCNGRTPNRPRPNPSRPNQRNPQVCIRFGNEAARRIAWRHCNRWIRGNSRTQSWRRDCRDVAINTCRGQVATEVQNQCGLPDTRTLRRLINECTEKVDSMIDNSRGSGRGRGWSTEEEMMLS